MRLHPDIADHLTTSIQRFLPGAEVYLFGSRADDNAKGGDIDILVLGSRKLTLKERIAIRLAFFDKFGEQKIDILSFPSDTDDPFVQWIVDDAIRISV